MIEVVNANARIQGGIGSPAVFLCHGHPNGLRVMVPLANLFHRHAVQRLVMTGFTQIQQLFTNGNHFSLICAGFLGSSKTSRASRPLQPDQIRANS